MICCAISAAAIGEIIGAKPRYPNARLIFGGLCATVVLLTVIGYTVIVVANLWHMDYDQYGVAIGSIVLFIVTGICSSVCIALSHEND